MGAVFYEDSERCLVALLQSSLSTKPPITNTIPQIIGTVKGSPKSKTAHTTVRGACR